MNTPRLTILAPALLGASLALACGCSADNPAGDGGTHNDASHIDGAMNLDGNHGDASGDGSSNTDTAPADTNCGVNTFAVRPIPPNVLVLLDRSCSMRRTPDGTLVAAAGTGTTKWEIAVTALQELTTSYASQVRWGLIYLPRSGTVADGAACGATPVCGGTTSCPEVAPGPGRGPAVMTELGMISPFDGCDNGMQQHITPLNDALIAAGNVTELHETTRADVVLLVTDGQESCLRKSVV